MKTKILAAVALMGASIGTAYAGPMTFTDLWDPANIEVDNNTVTHQHNINAKGYNKDTDTITGATLTFWLYDGEEDGGEYLEYKYDGTNGWKNSSDEIGSSEWELEPFVFYPSFNELKDGLLTFSLRSDGGDFVFAKSELKVGVNRNGGSTSVPEPATLALLSLGLLGVGFAARRRA